MTVCRISQGFAEQGGVYSAFFMCILMPKTDFFYSVLCIKIYMKNSPMVLKDKALHQAHSPARDAYQPGVQVRSLCVIQHN